MKMTLLPSARRAVVPPSLGSSPTSSPTPTRDRGGMEKGKGQGGGRSRTPSRGAPPLLPGSLPAGWVAKVDPASGKAYYINMVTKERQWHRPSDTGTSSNWVSKVDPASGKTYYVNMRTKETQWQPPSGTQPEDITTHNIERVFSGRGA